MKEIWKDIPNYEGYQVSNFGKVRTYNKTSFTAKHGVRHWANRILKYKGVNYLTGYRVDLWKNGKPNTLLVARLTAFTFLNKDITNHKLTVNHIDGNRFNNNITNLELISLAENIRHAFRTGLMPTKKTVIINKNTQKSTICISMAEANRMMNKNHGYIYTCASRNKYENKEYKWEII